MLTSRPHRIAIWAIIGAASFAAILAPSSPAEAGTRLESTFSSTPQGEAVTQLIRNMRAGKFDEFRALLEREALNRYGSEKGMKELLERFDKQSAGADIPQINFKTHLQQTMRPDTLLFSHQVRSVEVMRSAGDAPIWTVSVSCTNVIFFESLGTPDYNCRIESISATENRDGVPESRDFAGAQSSNFGKNLGGEPVVPAAADDSAGPGAGGAARSAY